MAKLYGAFPAKRMKAVEYRDCFTPNVGFELSRVPRRDTPTLPTPFSSPRHKKVGAIVAGATRGGATPDNGGRAP